MSAKLSPSLPLDDHNGLSGIARQLLQNDGTHLIVATVDTKKIETDCDSGMRTPTARILHVEAWQGDETEAEKLREMLTTRYDRRTGAEPLEFDE